ncbi:DsrE family protein [Sphingobacterium spiritivorum]|uniref:DsrE family protein n=1 Tax=Sphingobacterium spiritivorum TaxID=258 RepID=UPI001F451EE5|nr:DsrE family protein [Sphingobacterium spiritivorum]
MMNKKLMLIVLILISITTVYAQSKDPLLQNKEFTGAEAKLKSYKAIYQLDTNDPKIIEKAIRNINNALDDPRLQGKLQIELITFSGGTEAYLKSSSKFEEPLKKLIQRGVIVAQCLNSLKERNLSKDQLFDFVAYVPSGNGELIIRSLQGWTIIKP